MLAMLGICLTLAPLVPGLIWVLAPAVNLATLLELVRDGQFYSAALSTLGSAARGMASALEWSSPPQWITIRDPYAISLTITMAIKETWFLLWIMATLLGEQAISRQITLANSLGYSRRQVWATALLPQLLPRMGWPLVAVLAYSLSVVDMAVILGPSTPPTLAVLSWQWLSDPDDMTQAKGSAAALCLILMLGLLILSGRFVWWGVKKLYRNPKGIRRKGKAFKSHSLLGHSSWRGLEPFNMDLPLYVISAGWPLLQL